MMVDPSLALAVLTTVAGVAAFLGGALYLRLTTLLDDTTKRLQDVAVSLANHGARLDGLERHQ